MQTGDIWKRLVPIAAGVLCGLITAAGPVSAGPSLSELERTVDEINATYVREHPNDWGAKADAVVAARLLTTQRAWLRFRDLRCNTLVKVARADRGLSCMVRQTQLRLAELTDEPDVQLKATMSKVNNICQEGTAFDQMRCYSEIVSKREARVTAFIVRYGRTHDLRISNALAAEYAQWKIYADGACLRDYYDDAPMHPSSQQAAEQHCLLLLTVADFPFVDGWQ